MLGPKPALSMDFHDLESQEVAFAKALDAAVLGVSKSRLHELLKRFGIPRHDLRVAENAR